MALTHCTSKTTKARSTCAGFEIILAHSKLVSKRVYSCDRLIVDSKKIGTILSQELCLGLPVVGRLQTPSCSGGDTGCDDASFKRRSAELWVVLERSLSRLTSHHTPSKSSVRSRAIQNPCAGQDRRSLTSVSLNSSASDRATSSRSVFPFISGVSKQITGLGKKCLPSRVLRRLTLEAALPYPICLIMQTCSSTRPLDMDNSYFDWFGGYGVRCQA